MIKKRKIMTALVLTVVMVAGNAMSAFAETRKASGRGYALYVDVYANATVTTNSVKATMSGSGNINEPSGKQQNVYGNVKIHYAYYVDKHKQRTDGDIIDDIKGLKEEESGTYKYQSGESLQSCNVITYVGLSEDKCNTTGAVAKLIY